MTYHTADDNMFETCLKTLRQVSDCRMVVITDNVPAEFRNELTKRYGVEWVLVTPEFMDGNRAGCKVTESHKYCRELQDGDEVIIADVDLYYMADPFQAFVEFPDFDLAVTTRGYRYRWAINGGVYCYRISNRLWPFLDFWDRQVAEPTWQPLLDIIDRWDHWRQIPDWRIGQDFLNAIWDNKLQIYADYYVDIADIGPNYNWSPGKSSPRFMVELYEHYKAKDCAVLHLKGGATRMLYDDRLFDQAVTHHARKFRDWGPKLMAKKEPVTDRMF